MGRSAVVDAGAGSVIEAWKEGTAMTLDDHEDSLAWEEKWMNAVMSKGSLDSPVLSPPMRRPLVSSLPLAMRGASNDVDDNPSAEHMVADSHGKYHIPLGPVVQTGSLKRGRFVIPSTSRGSSSSSSSSSAKQLEQVRTSSSNTLCPDAKRIKSDPHVIVATGPSNAVGTDAKQIKVEKGQRAARARQLEELKRQVSQTEEDPARMPPDVKVKLAEDDAFRDVVDAFAKDTAVIPFMIEDRHCRL